MKDFKFLHLGQNLLLHPFKSLFWKERKILLLADVHFGKAAHFRKAGIPIPETIHQPDLDRISQLITKYEPERIIFLGDLFHSSYNSAWSNFEEFCKKHLGFKPELVLGNHDVLPYAHYEFLDVYSETLVEEPFVFSHKPLEFSQTNGLYNICGHIHPSIRLKGYAKQSLRVKCFYFGKNHGILPAFGNFTGSFKMTNVNSTDKIFGVTNEKIIQLF